MPPKDSNHNAKANNKGGGRRKRGGRNRDRKRTAPRGPPQTPQLKVTIRNIHKPYDSVRSLGEKLLPTLLQRANALDQQEMVLEDISIQTAIQAEEAALAKREIWEKEQEAKHNASKEGDKETDEIKEEVENADIPPTESAAEPQENASKTDKVVEGMENLTIDETVVTVRVLYMVPAKQTRRRGEKPGCVYLVLMAPPIADRTPPAPKPPPAPEATISNEQSKEQQQGEDAASAAPSVVVATQLPPPVDYSQDVARCRLMLQRSLDALIKCAKDEYDDNDKNSYEIEESLSAKTYRSAAANRRRDRLEGTIEDSPDYKQFFEKTQQAQEERRARPKPAPGGSLTVDGLPTSQTPEEPLAAIVMHLRQKKEEERKKKAKKKKSKKNATNSSNVAPGEEGKKKKRKKKKKKTPKGAAGTG